jgi:hypothetical protein
VPGWPRWGANGNIGMEYVAKSAPDGYTILIGTDSISSNPHVYKMAGLDRKVRCHLICRSLPDKRTSLMRGTNRPGMEADLF